MSVGQTKVKFARITDAGHQLLLLALGLVAPVGEDLVLGPHLTVVLDVGGHHQVRHRPSGHRDWLVTQRTYRYLTNKQILLNILKRQWI